MTTNRELPKVREKEEIELSILNCKEKLNVVKSELEASYINYRDTGVGAHPKWLTRKRAECRDLSLQLERFNFELRQASKKSKAINPIAISNLPDALAEPKTLRTRAEAQNDFAKLVQRRNQVKNEIDEIKKLGIDTEKIDALREEHRMLGVEIRLSQKEDELISKREKAERIKVFERQEHLYYCFHREAQKKLPKFLYKFICKSAGFKDEDFDSVKVRARYDANALAKLTTYEKQLLGF